MFRVRLTLTLMLQLALLLAALLWCWVDPGSIIDRQRRSVFDYYQRIAPRTYQNAPVRIVDIDDASLTQIGQWPWPRSAVAAMVGRLSQSGASAIVFDIVFAEPDRTSPAQILAPSGRPTACRSMPCAKTLSGGAGSRCVAGQGDPGRRQCGDRLRADQRGRRTQARRCAAASPPG
jgi:hypothetical protein